MSAPEWFRRVTWTEADAADFASHFKRARSANRAQYLRIQAFYLASTGDAELTKVALALLDRLIMEWPDSTQLAQAHAQRAHCLAELGEATQALDAYRDSFVARRAQPNWQNNAHFEFGTLVISLGRTDLYDEAVSILDEFRGSDPFPAERYAADSIRAIVADFRGDQSSAKHHARRALAAAEEKTSPFVRHKNVGLVRNPNRDIHDRLRAIAGQSTH